MLERALAAGVPFSWFTADEAYGQAGYLREWLENRDVSYAVATRCDHQLTTCPDRVARADALIAELPASTWQRFSVGAGAYDPREYDWARRQIDGTWARGHWLLRAAASATRPRSPTTSASARPVPGWSTWPGQLGPGGTWKKRSSRPRARPGSNTTRCTAGGPGTPTSPCPCSDRRGSMLESPCRKGELAPAMRA